MAKPKLTLDSVRSRTDATVSSVRDTLKGDDESVIAISIDEIRSNPYQPRFHFDETMIANLADSMSGPQGLIQPVVVRAVGGEFQLLAGERRLRAAKLLGWTKIKSIVRAISDEEMMISAMAENNHREDLTDLEKALAYGAVKQVVKNSTKLAEEAGISRVNLYRYLAFLDLPVEVLELLKAHPTAVTVTISQELKQTINTLLETGVDIKDICRSLEVIFLSPMPRYEWANALYDMLEDERNIETTKKEASPKNTLPAPKRKVELKINGEVFGKVSMTPKAMQLTLPVESIPLERRNVFLEKFAELVEQFKTTDLSDSKE